MSFRTLELPGLWVDRLSQDLASQSPCFDLRFEGQIIKTLEGARQRTRWQQAGKLILSNARCDNLQQFAPRKGVTELLIGDENVLSGAETDKNISYPYAANNRLRVKDGQLKDNICVYQDMIRLPLHSFGDIVLTVNFDDYCLPLIVYGDEIEVCLHGTPQYIEHLNE